MSWTKISTEVTRTPRNLTRKFEKPSVVETPWGPVEMPGERPSVDGEAEVSHDYFRCQCGAGAVTKTGQTPSPCVMCDKPRDKVKR